MGIPLGGILSGLTLSPPPPPLSAGGGVAASPLLDSLMASYAFPIPSGASRPWRCQAPAPPTAPRRQLSNSAAFRCVLQCSGLPAPCPLHLSWRPPRADRGLCEVSGGSGSRRTPRGRLGTAGFRETGTLFPGVPVAPASQVQAPSRLTRNSLKTQPARAKAQRCLTLHYCTLRKRPLTAFIRQL